MGSPATDFDGDGITDASDACVEIPRGADGNGDGCPDRAAALPDTDGDGVPNSADACPSTPAGGTDANADGCPDSSDPSTGGGTPGGGVPTPPGGSSPDTTPPVLTASARKQRALRARALIWTASCDEACSYAATAMLGKKRLGKLAKQLAAGAQTKLKIRLSRKSQALLRKALKRRKTATVKLKVAAVDAAGNRGTATTKIVVKR
jgi:Thrombospondin type 3 repeat